MRAVEEILTPNGITIGAEFHKEINPKHQI